MHNLQCCRICCQTVHNKDECIIADLYDVEDVNYFLQQATLLTAYNEVFNKLTSNDEQLGAINPLQNNFIPKTFDFEQHNQQIKQGELRKKQFQQNQDEQDIYEDQGTDSENSREKNGKKLSL
eukprot:TRINITY_DN3875_c0_g1_i3.p2 TRINITY_DN3875_c0_g1~~TRINITY_DN3875_c0_g1_i3.p2  ORF type:complete len:123 (+),score=25.67 TRINITY_DN3875_c0_g1_i3:112-480(+)